MAVELTSSNTKPVVQEFQSECLARWLPCPLPGDLHQPKLLGKYSACGSWYLVSWEGRTTESRRFGKVLKNISLISKALD